MFKRMERWTMTYWALAPRTVTKYLSFENQGRDSCKQTILPSELLFKFCEARNKFITWDAKHIRWASMTDAEQVRQVRMSCVWNVIGAPIWNGIYMYQIKSVPRCYFGSCASDKSNRCPDLIFYTIRRCDIVLCAWNYPGVENFSRTDKLFCNAYSFSIPLVATVSSSSRCRGHTNDLNRGTEPYWSNFHYDNQPNFVLLCGIHFGAPIQFTTVFWRFFKQ